jgi:uridylate kinase
MASRKIICVDLGSALYPSKESGIELNAIKSIAEQFSKLCEKGYRIVAFVGPGELGEEYVGVASRFTKERKALQDTKRRTSEANALLLIDCLLSCGLQTRSTPFENNSDLDEFVRLRKNWDVLVAQELSRASSESLAASIKAERFILISEKSRNYKKRNEKSLRIVTSYDKIASTLLA